MLPDTDAGNPIHGSGEAQFEARDNSHDAMDPGLDISDMKAKAPLAKDARAQKTHSHGLYLKASLKNTQEELDKVYGLFSMASRISDQVAWQVDLLTFQLTWAEDLRAIYELPPGPPPGVEETLSFFAPEHQQPIRELFEKCIATGAGFDKELQIITGKGQRLWIRIVGEASRAPTGEIRWIQGVTQNIDRQKQAEAREQTLARRLATTLENISDAFFLVNDAWEFVFLNRQTEYLSKRSSAELLGKTLWEVFPEAIGTQIEVQYRKAVEKRVTVRFETFFVPLDIWLEISAYPTDEGLAVYFRDITQKRIAAEHLELMQTAVAKLNEMVIITDADLTGEAGPRIVFVNDAFVHQTGYERSEVLGKSPYILHGPNTQDAELDRIISALETRQPARSELINYTKSGEEIWVELVVAPIVSEEGCLTHFVTVRRDITKRKQAEAHILMLNAELERRVQERTVQLEALNSELEAFSYSVAHDLRAPLNTINGFGQILLKSNEKNLDDKGRHYLRRIHAGTQQMGNLIEGLMSLAKVSRGELVHARVDFSALARQVEQECREHDPARQVQVQVKDGLLVEGDKVLLLIVMQNLMGNAWKYTARQEVAQIVVGCETAASGDSVYFIKDNGAGFDMAQAHKLFGAFQRLHESAEFAGTGIGLATAHKIILRHGGRVWAKSVLGQGATFYFTLG
ncbi:MAG: sensor signal transduction histidine kinase [Polaromonas sp.]|nr:sensor signal transduction histidine kinase [Polaromonas sp.]